MSYIDMLQFEVGLVKIYTRTCQVACADSFSRWHMQVYVYVARRGGAWDWGNKKFGTSSQIIC
jgi:hypothetical protein